MVRRRRDQADAWCGVTGPGDPWVNLSRRKVSAFAGFRSLCHLDLDFLSAYQIPAGNAEAGACHLFDGRTAVIGCACGVQSFFTFTAFTGVGFAVEHVHGKGKGLMGFLRNGTIGHGACLKPFYNAVHALNFLNGDAFFRETEVHKAS